MTAPEPPAGAPAPKRRFQWLFEFVDRYHPARAPENELLMRAIERRRQRRREHGERGKD